jgi:DNA gyrase/topoisomerase IV subunit A
VLGLPAAERFPTLLAVSDFDAGCLVMATSRGGIKRTALTAFSKLRATGLAAVKLLEVRVWPDSVWVCGEGGCLGGGEEAYRVQQAAGHWAGCCQTAGGTRVARQLCGWMCSHLECVCGGVALGCGFGCLRWPAEV